MWPFPSVHTVQVRREVLDAEVDRLRELPYSVWRDVLASPMTRRATGRDGRGYRLRIRGTYADRGSEDIRVSATLLSPWLGRTLMQATFVITPDNELIG